MVSEQNFGVAGVTLRLRHFANLTPSITVVTAQIIDNYTHDEAPGHVITIFPAPKLSYLVDLQLL